MSSEKQSTVDRVLAAIDTGLQGEMYGLPATRLRPIDRPVCWRCGAAAKPGYVCDGCRAWMCGESDDDPANTHHRTVEGITNLASDVDAGEQQSVVRRGFGAPGLAFMWSRLFAGVNQSVQEGTSDTE